MSVDGTPVKWHSGSMIVLLFERSTHQETDAVCCMSGCHWTRVDLLVCFSLTDYPWTAAVAAQMPQALHVPISGAMETAHKFLFGCRCMLHGVCARDNVHGGSLAYGTCVWKLLQGLCLSNHLS